MYPVLCFRLFFSWLLPKLAIDHQWNDVPEHTTMAYTLRSVSRIEMNCLITLPMGSKLWEPQQRFKKTTRSFGRRGSACRNPATC